MKTTLTIGFFAVLGLFTGCASSDGPADEDTTETTDERSQKLCCIEFTCPSNEGIGAIGCKNGPTINAAAKRCQQLCGEPCSSGGLICD